MLIKYYTPVDKYIAWYELSTHTTMTAEFSYLLLKKKNCYLFRILFINVFEQWRIAVEFLTKSHTQKKKTALIIC